MDSHKTAVAIVLSVLWVGCEGRMQRVDNPVFTEKMDQRSDQAPAAKMGQKPIVQPSPRATRGLGPEIAEERIIKSLGAIGKRSVRAGGGGSHGLINRGRGLGLAQLGGGRLVLKPRVAGDVTVARPKHSTEEYHRIAENDFEVTLDEPLSTFSIDVDTAAYANVRRFIEQQHRLPPKDSARIEELINYFDYDYEGPSADKPFAVHTEIAKAPWNQDHKLVHIGLQGRRIDMSDAPPSNLVFLIDVSGSMRSADKLPLLVTGFKMLVQQLRPQDQVAIVVYASREGVVLPPTSGAHKKQIISALDGLQSGGSTAGGAGIQLAYKLAQDNFVEGGTNRVILATDGDFNVGMSSTGELTRLIETKRRSNVFLSVLGFGRGNYKDSRMETLSNKGNGTAYYIDNILEAKKVLVNELGGTLVTIAKDVKLQVEFNPAVVKGYRLIGYENRILAARDFNDDKRDAGELGAGHTVTALYEIIPADSNEAIPGVDPLKYQTSKVQTAAANSGELCTVKLRYKKTTGTKSVLMTLAVKDQLSPLSETTDAYRFSSAVAEFGLLLRESKYRGQANYPDLIKRAIAASGNDPEGYRAGFVQLARKAQALAQVQGRKIKASKTKVTLTQ
ncbi:MAG: VWA domain-containing protein [Myxococcota bacterium]|nr:VWA domain-containing protein [Myxococcota bacterium]